MTLLWTLFANPLIALAFATAGQFMDRLEGGWPDVPGRGIYYVYLATLILAALTIASPSIPFLIPLLGVAPTLYLGAAAGLLASFSISRSFPMGKALAPRRGHEMDAVKRHLMAAPLGFWMFALHGLNLHAAIFGFGMVMIYVAIASALSIYHGRKREEAEIAQVAAYEAGEDHMAVVERILPKSLNQMIERIRGATFFLLAWFSLAIRF